MNLSEWFKTALTLAAIIVLGLWLTFTRTGARNERIKLSTQTDYQLCVQVEGIKVSFRDFILDAYNKAERDLGKPGTPGYAYYHNHPNEFLAAVHSIEDAKARTRAKFKPRNCNQLPTQGGNT